MSRLYEDADGPIPASINILDVLRGVGRRRLMIAGLSIISFLGAVAAVGYMSPVFTTEAQVLVQSQVTPFDQVNANLPATIGGGGADSRDIDTQIAVARSEDMGRRVVAALKLDRNPAFNTSVQKMGRLRQLKIMLGFAEDPRLLSPQDLALNSYKSGLTVYQIPGSNVIAIKVSASDGKGAADMANALAETYVSFTREAGLAPTERARQWLAQQIDQLRAKVSDAEAAVEKYRAEAGLIQGAKDTTLGTQQLSELSSQITLAEAAKSDARSRADSIRNLLNTKGSVDASADVLASAVIQGLKSQQTEAQKAVAELSAVYLPNHPKMIAARRQLDDINKRIRSEALRIVEGLEEQARIAEAREASLRKSLDEMKAQAGGANLDDVKLKALERDAQANRTLLESMLSRYAEATAKLDPSAQPASAQIIQRASVPASPSFPKTGPMVLLITIAGMSLSLGLAFLLEIMAAAARLNDRMVRAAHAEAAAAEGGIAVRSADASRAAPLPPGEPTVPAPPTFHVTLPPHGWQPGASAVPPLAAFPAARSFDTRPPATSVEAAIDWLNAQRGARSTMSLALAGLGASAADTAAVTLALARTLASRGSRVIAIDLSGDSASLQLASGVGEGQGISDLMLGTADFTKVIARDSQSAAHVMRHGRDPAGQARGHMAERLPPVLAALLQSYDSVLLHFGEATADTPPVLRLAQAALLLAPAGRAGDVARAIAALKGSGFTAIHHLLIGPAAQPAPGPESAVAGA